MKVSDYIVRFLEMQGVEYVFGYQGGMVTHMVDSLSKSEKTRFVPCYHEQNAAFAAEGYARMSGRFGVCLVTSGPGATNTLTSVADAYFDSLPVLYITGQVNTYEYKYDKKIRQQGFQEVDIVSMSRPVAKDSFLADDSTKMREYLVRAVRSMLSGRKGPVVLDLPMDVQRADISAEDVARIESDRSDVDLSKEDVETIASVMRKAERPLVLCGGGIVDTAVQNAAYEFLKRTGYPYVVSLKGKGLVDETAPACVGMIGSYGNRCANFAMSRADVVLALGSRLDLRQTGNRKSKLLSKIKFVRIDPDSDELEGGALPNQIAFRGDCRTFLTSQLAMNLRVPDSAWYGMLQGLKRDYSQQADVGRLSENDLPYRIMNRIMSYAGKRDGFVVDVGQNQMWAAQTIRSNGKQPFVTSGGMAPMGYAIPAAVGFSFADRSRHVYCLCGDGGFHIAVQALLLISQYHLPITVVVLNNRALGMITQFQRLYFGSNLAGTTKQGGYCVPNLEHLAKAYGLRYLRVSDVRDFTGGYSGGELIEVVIEGATSVVPKLEFNKDLDKMTPSVDLFDRMGEVVR